MIKGRGWSSPASGASYPVTGAGSAVAEIAPRGLDSTWDAFVDSVGGDHVQTTRWATVKSEVGWTSERVVVRREGELIGGCQLLLRRLSPFGTVAYASRGPVIVDAEPGRIDAVLEAVRELAIHERLLLLKVQPPITGSDLVPPLEQGGFVASGLATAPSATVRLDLSGPLEGLLAAMRPGARSNIGKARRKGVTVRTGTSADLAPFVALVQATGRRQGFSPYPARYYEAMWHNFAADGRAVLFLAEHQGRTLSAALLIAWGDVVTYKMGGWSGERTNLHPNELLHWTGIEWARGAGYRWYDLEGINDEVGRAIVEGRDPGPAARQGVTHFKLGFGGEVVIAPSAYDYSPRPFVAAAVRRAESIAGRRSWLVGRLLGRGG